MAGTVIPLLPYRQFDMSSLPAGGSAIVTVASRIDVSTWREVQLLARLHSGTTWSGGASVIVAFAPDPWTREDPAALWPLKVSASVTFLEGTDANPNAKPLAFPVPIAPLVWVALRFVQGSAAAPFTPCLSIDLNVKGF